MKSTTENPLAFIEWYLTKQIYVDLDDFHSQKTNFLVQDGLIKIEKNDIENHIIYFKNIAGVDGLEDNFQNNFKNILKRTLDPEVEQSLFFVESGFQKIFSVKKEVKAYAELIRIKIRYIESLSAVKKFYFISDYLTKIKDTVDRYSTEVKHYNFTPSFVLLAENEKDQQAKIERLFNLLTESPSLIDTSKEEFINAFSGKEVTIGVNWLVIGKNKIVSKISLFYFIEELQKNNHLSNSIIHDLNKYVLYTFRDNHGQELKNLKQSKTTISNIPTQKDRIDTIISSL
ncbi:hypothetical protein KO493_03210 [Tamlana agarivorans]|uniref:Uncharacterized protein n=1 Tax=Pseudotamlana agarivorans TaxID=481183 RepID=A0ACC5U5V9_9FLAO|nr:hypothetical protein [Tamlana agarivorans]MBU2949702.1 hypothetical protein [Tamlana agarivorans]